MKEYRCLYCRKIIKDDPRGDRATNVCIKCTIELTSSLARHENITRRLTEEEKRFIADQYQNKDKSGQQIVIAFKEKFGWIPSASEINKYRNYQIDEPEHNKSGEH